MPQRFVRSAALAAVGFALFGAAGEASADTVDVTLTGIIEEGADLTGVFGSPGSLRGDAVTVVFQINTAKGIPYTDPSIPAQALYGGSACSLYTGDAPPCNTTTSIPVTALVTVNNHSVAIGGTSFSFAGSQENFGPDANFFAAAASDYNTSGTSAGANPPPGPQGSVVANVASSAVPYSLTTPFAVPSGGEILWNESNGSYFKSFDDAATLRATPTPPAWVSMLIGLGFLGYLVRRRQQKDLGLAVA